MEKRLRKGTLGGRPNIVEIEGFYHWMTAVCYVLRNPVHHGVAPTPFAYRHSSANAIFRNETGKGVHGILLSRKSYYKYLPKGAKCPQGYMMDSSGLILRESVLDLSDIEHRFATPRSFLFYMNRLSSEEWRREQDDDRIDAVPITLELLERNVSCIVYLLVIAVSTLTSFAISSQPFKAAILIGATGIEFSNKSKFAIKPPINAINIILHTL